MIISTMHRYALGAFLICSSGCSHESWTAIEETSRLPSVAAPILTPVNWAAMAGRAITSTSSVSSGSERSKQFVLSLRVMDDFSSDGKFMEDLLAVQSRFRNHDWGAVSPEQLQSNNSYTNGKGSAGRYLTGSNRSAIIIVDAGNEFKVRYENESEE